MSKRQQTGFTVIELLVGIAVGMLVAAAILSVYINTLRSSGDTVQASRLNQEMNAIMNIMANDIRRAGYWGGSNTSASGNPFAQKGSTALEVHALDGGVYDDDGSQGSGSCIVYAYDLNSDGDLDKGSGAAAPNNDNNEGFGFRWKGGSSDPIQMKCGHTEVNDCGDTGEDWGPLTDANFIEITALTFDLANSKCLNTSEPNKVDEASGTKIVAPAVENFNERDCYYDAAGDDPPTPDFPPDTGEEIVEIREVEITLEARLVDAPEVTSQLNQTVQVRNNLFSVTP